MIERLQQTYKPAVSDTRCFHFRPHFRTRGVNRPPVLQPHSNPPRGLLISLCKLFYWLADCWFGYLAAVRPVRRRSGLLLFDRYYPDVLVDPVRYRLPERSLRFARWLMAFTPQPDLYILLDAPADVVQRRKAELTSDEVRRQRVAYLRLFQSFSSRLIVNAERPVNEVAQRIALALSDCDAIPVVVPVEPVSCQPLK